MKLRSRPALLVEFLALFVALPLALFLLPARIPPIPLLWLWCLYCFVALFRDPAFSRRRLWETAPLRSQLLSILVLFAAAAILVALAISHYAPQMLFDMPRQHTWLWAAVIVFYPFLSVWPQGITYRVFVVHRYQPLFAGRGNLQPSQIQNEEGETRQPNSWALTLLSAASFAMVHIVFHNWIAVALTLPGGILFARRYQHTRSHPVSCFEHALYGCFLFTIGLGRYFYVRFV